MAAQQVIDALIEKWRIRIAFYPADHPLLRGARASWRGRLRLLVVNETLSPAERLFAIAHELGHRVCHPGQYECHGNDIDDAPLPTAVPVGEGRVWGYSPRQVREVEANIYAAELLAPSVELRDRFVAGQAYDALAREYGVTPSCMLNALLGAVLGGVADDPEPATGADGLTLDDSQSNAAQTSQRIALVDAGPGTGKTRTLIARAEHLVKRLHVPAHQLLILTFSNRAAEEVRERLRCLLSDAPGITVATFHGFALDLLRRFPVEAGFRGEVRVIDDVDAMMLLERAIPDLQLQHYAHLSWPGIYFSSILDAVSRMRDELMTLDDFRTAIEAACTDDTDTGLLGRLYETYRVIAGYENLLAARDMVDYGGLIVHAINLIRHNPRVAAAVRRQYRHVLVDEYQDVNRASAVLLQEMAVEADSLWVVGDVRQAIYRFRGACPENMINFWDDYPTATGDSLTLDVNYRSVAPIVSALVGAAGNMTGATPIWTARRTDATSGASLVIAPDYASEVAGIVADISQSIASGRDPGEHAVLCCTHAQAADVSAALAAANLSTTYLGHFFLRPEVKDMLALLELCLGLDGSSLLRLAHWPEYVLPEQFVEEILRVAREKRVPFPKALDDPEVTARLSARQKVFVERLHNHIQSVRYYPDPGSILLHYLFGDASYLRTLLRTGTVRSTQAAAALFQLVVLARGFSVRPVEETTDNLTRAFLRYVRRLLIDRENGIHLATAFVPGAVNVLTVHASKGLEFPVVYVPNLVKGRFPVHAGGGKKAELPPVLHPRIEHRLDDERRLLFVAMSRARDRLVLSRAERYYGPNRSNPCDALEIVRGIDGLSTLTWPQVEQTISDDEATDTADLHTDMSVEVADDAPIMSGHDLDAIARCPRRYHYQKRLDLSGGDRAQGYHLFARLTRNGIAWLRTAWNGSSRPGTWNEAASALIGQWDAQWPIEDTLGSFYKGVALQIFEREYRKLGSVPPPSGNTEGGRYVIEVEGYRIAVEIDAIEEHDGTSYLIWERITRKSDDTTSIVVGLYGAVIEVALPGRTTSVAIRYFDRDEPPVVVTNAPHVIRNHKKRLQAVLRHVRAGRFPALPRSTDDCLRCPFVIVCPGPNQKIVSRTS